MKKELLMSYIKANVAPILIDFMFGVDIPNAIVIPGSIDAKELVGHYESLDYKPPKWYDELITNNHNLLVIDLIDSIKKEEQAKFIEILKYRKIDTFELPEDCVIIVTTKEINKDKINEEIYSLLAQI